MLRNQGDLKVGQRNYGERAYFIRCQGALEGDKRLPTHQTARWLQYSGRELPAMSVVAGRVEAVDKGH